MGGTVAETIRQENGEIIKMARKTGAYNWMFFSKKFNDNQIEEAIQDHILNYIQMKEDYETGKPYKFNMSPVYGWCNHTAPVDYGLVVIDFKAKKIHSMQDYDSPGQLNSGYFSPNMKHSNEVADDYQFIVNNNCVNVFDEYMNYCGDIHAVFGSENTYDKIQKSLKDNYLNIIKNSDIKFLEYIFIPKALENFTIISYEQNPEEIIQFLHNLAADGFTFNQEEIQYWKEFINVEEYVCENLDDEEYDAIQDIDQYTLEYKTRFEQKIDNIANNILDNSNDSHHSTNCIIMKIKI